MDFADSQTFRMIYDVGTDFVLECELAKQADYIFVSHLTLRISLRVINARFNTHY